MPVMTYFSVGARNDTIGYGQHNNTNHNYFVSNTSNYFKEKQMSNVTPIRKESQHPALASMRLRIENLEKTIASLNKELAFLKEEIKKLHA